MSVFILSPVMNDIPGVNNDIGDRIECVYIRNRDGEIAQSLIGVGGIQGEVSIGDLRDDHDAALCPLEGSPA
jgi:hypothetical protein